MLKASIRWWLAFLAALLLPLYVGFVVQNFGGYFAEYMPNLAWSSLILGCCVVGLLLSLRLLMRSHASRPLRVAGMACVCILLGVPLLALLVVEGECSQPVELTRLGEISPHQIEVRQLMGWDEPCH